MSLLPSILAKREGRALDETQIRAFVTGVTDGSLPDYQISAFLMTIFFRGMDRGETVMLTRAVAESGAVLDWSDLDRPTADKHSTGGVGDKLSLVVAPLAAVLGVAVPMLSGRGLGFTGGTLDKLEAIPGLRTRLDHAAFRRQVSALGCAFVGQSEDLAPADRRLYALRDVTGTIESTPLIVSSILGKKLAAGPRSLVIDLKVGRGAFMPDLAAAKALGRALRETAAAFDRPCSVIFSAMDAPLGRAVGNGPEVAEALAVLAGRGPAGVRDLSVELAAEMLRLAGASSDREAARAAAAAALDDGRALARFGEVVDAQGGRLGEPAAGWGLPAPAHRRAVTAAAAGHLPAPDAGRVGWLAVELGAGRRMAEDGVDPTAGIVFRRDWGERVAAGEELAVVEGCDAARVERAAEGLARILAPRPEPEPAPPLVLARLDEHGFRLGPV
ncbi:MAG: thymidine phosphorylase [Candidatus Krumholzibacteriota bacterium]|nr:thymidine phosphorylase [Candidatus Krumholzibacteriota bacterium]